MKDTFKAYLAQQKADNKYMTAPSKELLGEGIFDNRKYDCYSVSIDFTSEYMVKTLTNMLINDYKVEVSLFMKAVETLMILSSFLWVSFFNLFNKSKTFLSLKDFSSSLK